MDVKKALEEHLKTLKEFQDHLFNQGHTFWHCDAQDASHNKPFYYFQINRSTHMSTCSTCYQLMQNRKKIRAIEKELGLPLTPLTSNIKELEHVKRMSISDKGDFNPNFHYM